MCQNENGAYKKKDMGSENPCTEQRCCLYLSQISASCELVRNMLQERAVETKFCK